MNKISHTQTTRAGSTCNIHYEYNYYYYYYYFLYFTRFYVNRSTPVEKPKVKPLQDGGSCYYY